MDKLKSLNLQKKYNLYKYKNQVIIAAATLFLLLTNLVVSKLPLRLDLSKGRAYTLSSSTKKILKGAKNQIDLKLFVSSELPSKLIPLKTEVIDLLNEYKKQNTKVKVSILDPKDKKIAKEAEEAGIPQLQFSQLEQDKYNVTASRFGISINYGEKKEVIPQATDLSSLEYSISSAIYRLTRTEIPKVGIVGSNISFNPQTDPLATMRNVLQQQVAIDDIDISSDSTKSIEPSYKTLLVIDSNQKEFSNEEIKKLKSYIEDKGKVIFMIDGLTVPSDLNGSPVQPKHNLFNLLKEYGISLNKDLVLSNSYELVNFGNGVVSFVSPYPYWIKASLISEKLGNFSNIGHLTFPWPSSISLGKRDGYNVEALVNTVKQSWNQTKNFTLFPQNIKEPSSKEFKEYTLVAQSTKKNGGAVVVIPTSRFVKEEFVRRDNDNLEFLLNMVDNLASGGSLSGIRQREVNFYSLPTLSDSQKSVFKYGTILFLPLLFGLYGLARIMKRN